MEIFIKFDQRNFYQASILQWMSNRSGMAATEFALLLPVMLTLLFGLIEVCMALESSRRTELAGEVLSDLISQEIRVDIDNISDVFKGVEQVISNQNVDADFRIISVIIDENTKQPVVDWSRDNQGRVPYAEGAAYDKIDKANFYDDTASIVVSEIDHRYTSPLLGYFIGKQTFSKRAFRWPRRSNRVELTLTGSNENGFEDDDEDDDDDDD